MSRETLREPFFEDLWPLILNTHRCQVRSQPYSSSFIPKKPFEIARAQALLAQRGFKDYVPPIEVTCFKKQREKEKKPKAAAATDCSFINWARRRSTFLPRAKLSSTSSSRSDKTSSSEDKKRRKKRRVQHKRLCRKSNTKSRGSHPCHYNKLKFKRRRRKCCDSIYKSSLANDPLTLVMQKLRELKAQQQQHLFLKLAYQLDSEEELDNEQAHKQNSYEVEDFIWQEDLTPASVKSSKEDDCYECLNVSPDALKVQHANLQKQLEHRKRMAYNFMNRKIPWYQKQEPYQMQDISHMLPLLVRSFNKSSFEFEVVTALFYHKCRFMLMDLGAAMDLDQVTRFLQLCNIIHIVCICRTCGMDEIINCMGPTFHGIYVEEDLENIWQEELQIALNVGYNYAVQQNLFKYSSNCFTFVFSSHRDYCAINTFRVLHHC